MHLHEFQAKELLERYGVKIPKGRIAGTSQEARRLAERMGFDRFAIKAQIRTIERLAEGGVRFAASPDGTAATAAAMLEKPLLRSTPATTAEDVRWVLIEEAIPCALQLYVAVVLDQATGEIVLLTSRSGGTGIESRFANEPGLITKTPLKFTPDGLEGDFEGAAQSLELPTAATTNAIEIFRALARLTHELDALQVEINPLALTPDHDLIALDAKLQIDDHALFRHPSLAAFRDAVSDDEEDPLELAADRHQINYAALPGSVGIVVNGAGLALSTLDMLRDFGASPANFMDIRTTATSLDIAYGVGLVLSNPNTAVLLINVHGGGMQRCDTIAEGIAIAISKTTNPPPIVARLAGNNADFARVRLTSSGVIFEEAADMTEAVKIAATYASKAGSV
ncbi:MAG: acetate--CoA ligase family protein [Alphaproteobacteria bacterium]|nr:acetate--CoA ligase family protein [Alphaproteobacteria bacterium]